MGESENKHCTVFSWADEVEKEEEEAKAQVHDHDHQKHTPNPFGSARPRETVLHERGIDWRKLDQDLQHQPSRISIQAPVELTAERKQMILQSKGSVETNIGLIRGNVPQFPLNPHNHIPGIIVPQLKYPPKIVPTNLFRPTIGSYNFQCKTLIEPEKENTFHEPRMEQFSPGLNSHIHHYSHYIDQHRVGTIGSNRREFEAAKGQSMKAQHNSSLPRELRKSTTHEHRGSAKFEPVLADFPVASERRTLVIRDKRSLSADQRDRKNTRGGNHGRGDGLLNSPPPIQTIQNRQRKRSHQDSDKKGRSNESRMVSSAAEEVSWEKIQYDTEWQSSPGKVAGCSIDAVVNGGRAETGHNMKLKRANSSGNYGRKRR